MIVTIVRRAALIGLVAASACVTGRGRSVHTVNGQDWSETLTRAQAAATEHRYADADRLLAEYGAHYPGSEAGIESIYWRGVIALEPTNRDASPQIAAALFESYTRSGSNLPHRVEAEIFYRLATRLQGTSNTVASGVPTTVAPSSSTSSADLRAKDSEIQRLKDELAKANDELERIKRRLTAPTKP